MISRAPSIASAADRHRIPWLPEDNGLLLANADPLLCGTDTVQISSGFVFLQKLLVPTTVTVGNLIAYCTTAGATLTSGQCLAGIYDSSGALVAKTATQHTAWQSTGVKTMALTAEAGQSLTIPAGWVYTAFLANGTTAPTFRSLFPAGNEPIVNFGLSAGSGWRTAYSTSGSITSLASTLVAISTASGAALWVGVT